MIYTKEKLLTATSGLISNTFPLPHDLHDRLQLNFLLLQQLIPIHILNRIGPHILQRLLKLVRLLRTIRKQMVLDQSLRRLAQPLEQTEILELVGPENLEHLNVLVVGKVLDEMSHVPWHNAHVAGLVVEGAGGTLGSEDRDACAAFDEVGPFVGVG